METEMEYWRAIEDLNDQIWITIRDLTEGFIQDSKGEVTKSIQEKRQEAEQLIIKLGEKFGVIRQRDYPKVKLGQSFPAPPDGKIYYFQWSQKMKKEFHRNNYENIICSACPFSEGVQKMIELDGAVPCAIFPGLLISLSEPSQCAMLKVNGWDKVRLHKEIIKKTGENAENALDKFLEKEWDLRKVS